MACHEHLHPRLSFPLLLVGCALAIAAVLLLGAEMNAVIEHMSAEGKDPGEKTFDGSDDPDPKQHVSGLGRDHSIKATSDEA